MLFSLQKIFHLIFSLCICPFLAYSIILSGYKKKDNDFWNNKNNEISDKNTIRQKVENNIGFESTFEAIAGDKEDEGFAVAAITEEKILAAEGGVKEDESISTTVFPYLNFTAAETGNKKEAKSREKRIKRQVLVRRRRRRRRKRCRCKGKKTKVVRKNVRGRRRGRRVVKCICKKKKAEAPEPPPEEEEAGTEDYDYLDYIDTEGVEEEAEEEKPEPEPEPAPAPAPEPTPEPLPGFIITPTKPTVIVSPINPLYNYGYGYGGSPIYPLFPGQYNGLRFGAWPYYGVPRGTVPVYSYPAIPRT